MSGDKYGFLPEIFNFGKRKSGEKRSKSCEYHHDLWKIMCLSILLKFSGQFMSKYGYGEALGLHLIFD